MAGRVRAAGRQEGSQGRGEGVAPASVHSPPTPVLGFLEEGAQACVGAVLSWGPFTPPGSVLFCPEVPEASLGLTPGCHWSRSHKPLSPLTPLRLSL